MDTAVLTAISNLVLTIPDKKWNMGFWWKPCGSVGCAIGHAVQKGLIPGLVFKVRSDRDSELYPQRREVPERETMFAAVGLALGISERDAEWLFAPKKYAGEFADLSEDESEEFCPTQAQVSSRIAAYVLAGGRP